MKQADQPLWRFAQRLRSHHELGDGEIAAILSLPHCLTQRRANSYLVREGDEVQSCAILVAGYAVRHRTTGDGNRQVVAIYMPGDPLNLDHLYLPVADDDLQIAKTSSKHPPAEIALVPHEPLHDMMCEFPDIATAIMKAILSDAAVFREWLLNIGQRDASMKVGHLLCELAYRMEIQCMLDGDGILPFSQIQIAEATGLTPAHVNRTLKSLLNEGVIERKDQAMSINNWRSLARTVDFDPHYLNRRQLA